MRKKALEWWRELSQEDRYIQASLWREANIGDYRAKWDYQLIFKSDSTIESIYLYWRGF